VKSLYLRMCSWELVKGSALRSPPESGTDVEDPEGGPTELDAKVDDTQS